MNLEDPEELDPSYQDDKQIMSFNLDEQGFLVSVLDIDLENTGEKPKNEENNLQPLLVKEINVQTPLNEDTPIPEKKNIQTPMHQENNGELLMHEEESLEEVIGNNASETNKPNKKAGHPGIKSCKPGKLIKKKRYT